MSLATIPQAGTYAIHLEQGATYQQDFLVREPDGTTVFDLTGFSAYAQARTRGRLLIEFATSIDIPTGTVTVAASRETTALVTIAPDVFWDLRLSDDTQAFYLVRGPVYIRSQVTNE